MEQSYLRTERISVGYRGEALIRDISLSVRRGEILTLIGPNGAGKSTILKSLIRQLKLVAGTVVLDGKNMDTLSERELSTHLSVLMTDRIRPEGVPARTAYYAAQLRAYAGAMARITGRPVCRRVLYFLHCGRTSDVPEADA